MLVDYERAFLKLKREITKKPSHGKRDLLSLMAEIEVDCAVEDEGYDPSPPRRRKGNGKATPEALRVERRDAQLTTPLDVQGDSYGSSQPPKPARVASPA